MNNKKKLEQRKEFKEYLSIADKRVLDIKKSGIELIADDEVFVLVNKTNNYWISNRGRMVNNLRNNFHMHKTGYAHYTLSGINTKIETYTDKLVAEHFLENPNNYNKIWHIDRDKNNCYYRNLIWVSSEEYIDLERGIVLAGRSGISQRIGSFRIYILPARREGLTGLLRGSAEILCFSVTIRTSIGKIPS